MTTKKVTAKTKRLLQDMLLLSFLHFRDGEHEESAKILQQANEISDVGDVVDEINDDHSERDRDPRNDEGEGDDAAGREPGAAGGDVIEDEDSDLDEGADDTAVQARLKTVAAKLVAARSTKNVAATRKLSRRIYKLHSKLRAIRRRTAAAATVDTPAARQAAALANASKLKRKK